MKTFEIADRYITLAHRRFLWLQASVVLNIVLATALAVCYTRTAP